MSNKLKRKLLLLEVNEVPWRILDKFKDDKRFPNINYFFKNANNFTTVVASGGSKYSQEKLVQGISRTKENILIDSEELSPWVTWPTFHRGLKSNEHKIKFLGQDTSTFFGKPIWKEFLERGYNIGICGSLQSWPPIDPGINGFYIPDTFAHDEKCIPKYIESFQKFNLDQVQKNGLVIREKELLSHKLFGLLVSLPRLGLKTNTFVKTVNQIISEVFNKKYIARRPVFQCILFWDIFKNLYNVKNPPALSTFFTNHFASLMHRYWCDVFPEDFDEEFMQKRSVNHYETILFGLKIVDDILCNAICFCQKNPEITLVFVSSMGQDAITYTAFEGYSAEIENIDKLFNCLDIGKNEYKPLLAMVPQFSVEVIDPNLRQNIIHKLDHCYTKSGSRIFSVDEAGKSISVTIHTPSFSDIESGNFEYKLNGKVGKKLDWDEAGIIIHKLDAASAYHIPEGIMAVYGKGIEPDDSRKKIALQDCKQYLLDLVF